MKISNSILCVTGLGLALTFGTAMAADAAEGVERAAGGVERAAGGTVDAVTAPGKIVEGIAEDTATSGPVVGTVTGVTKGAVNAAGQVVKGAANIGVGAVEVGVGAVETILSPVTGGGTSK